MEHAASDPFLEVAMARLVRGEAAFLDLFPAGTRFQHPHDALEDLDEIGPFAPHGFLRVLGQNGAQAVALFDGQVHTSGILSTAVNR